MRKARIFLVAVVLGLAPVSSSLMVEPFPIWGQSQENQLDDLLRQGITKYKKGQMTTALETFQQALVLARQTGDRKLEATTLTGIGLVYNSTGQPQRALEFYQQALPITREVNDRSMEAATLNNIGLVYGGTGQFQRALEFYQQALTIKREVNDRSGEATTLTNLGGVYDRIGQPQRALEFFQQALPIMIEMNNRSGEATTLHGLGALYDNIGQPQRALESFQQALPIMIEMNNRPGEAVTLNNLGGVYDSIGQHQKALEFYQQALAITKEINNRSGEAVTLNNIGQVYGSIGQHQRALEFYQQALLIRREVNNRSGEAVTLNNIGQVYGSIGQPQRALEFFQQALPIRREVSDHSGEATTLTNIGGVYDNIGQPQRALEFYLQALPITREVSNRTVEATILNHIGVVYRDTNQLTLAITNLEQSSEITLKTRSGLQRENRNQFLVSNRGGTTALVDLLIDQNQAARAYEWANIYSTADLVDFNRLLNAKVGNPAAQTALDQWNQQNQQLAALRSQLEKAFTPQLSQSINDLEAKNRSQGEKIAKDFPEIAELLELKREDLTQLQAAIPAGTVVIQPVLLTNIRNVPNTIALFVLTRTTLTVKKVPIDPKEFDQLLETYRSQLENFKDPNYRDTSAKLYDILIKPIAPEIQSHSPQTLAIIATGKLRYLPFETLKDQESNQFLIQKYPVSYLTRLSSRSLQQNNSPSFFSLDNLKNTFDQLLKIFFPAPGVFGIGNPTPSKAPLPGATQEVQAIQNIFRNSQTLIEQAATLEAFKQDAPRFPILHLATHGCFQPNGCPDVGLAANTILFANNQQFPIADAALLGLNTRLLVLSACQTAQPAQGNGEEISGLAYVLECAGARAVMATLWSVEDKATRDLMINFYQNLSQGQDKAQALQQAKIAQINRHPYFWSAFLLIGDPR